MAMPFTVGFGAVALAAAAAALGGGTHDAGRAGGPADGAPAAEHPPALAGFGSCAAFAAHMRTEAGRRVGPYGLPGAAGMSPAVTDASPGGPFGGPERAAAPVAAAEAAPAGGAPGAGHSGTNVQEAGVDEPDLVKTDGRRLYVLTGDTLHAVDVTGARPRALGRVDLAGIAPTGLLLMEGRLLVLGEAAPPPVAMPRPRPGSPREVAPLIAPAQPPVSVVATVDVNDPTRPRVTGTLRVDGALVAARSTRGTVRVVTRTAPQPARMVLPAAGTRLAEAAALGANRMAVAASPAGAWLPRMTVRDERTGVTVRRTAVGCRAVGRPRIHSGLGMVTVLTLGVGDTPRVLDVDAVLTDAGVVYASRDSLYITTPRWVDPHAGAAPAGTTLVHRFDTSRPDRTTHRASGSVRGYPLNQFALSEHDGHLRIATTERPPWGERPGEPASESVVTVLGERAGRLARVGEVDGLGRGERIYAVRFLGDRGHVVTFRETDPLYVVDLADPARPRVRGELKIPGYSAYLHPVDAGTLIGIGQDATAGGRTLGTQVSLFDVADPARPRRVAQVRTGTGWSEAEADHHAVLHWPDTGLLVLPATARRGGAAGAVGLRVAAGRITPVGRIAHPGGAPIRRALVVGDGVYTVSDAGVGRSALDTLAPEGWLDLT